MPAYQIFFKGHSRKELLALPNEIMLAIERKIDELANNPRPHGCKKLSGMFNTYRIRIGNYRVIYTLEDRMLTVIIIKIAYRKESYR
jgi:mRNA interferase RelE/StbE